MKNTKVIAGIMAMAMTMVSAGMGMTANADSESLPEVLKQEGDVHVTIDKKTVTREEAMDGVLIYVRVDTPLVNFIEFGTQVDDRCYCKVITKNKNLSDLSDRIDNVEMLDVSMTASDNGNSSWYAAAYGTPSGSLSLAYRDGTFECMNLAALYIRVPEYYATAGERFEINYLSEGLNGGISKHIWKCYPFANLVVGNEAYLDFEARDYVADGVVFAENGWIQIEGEGTTEEPSATYQKGDIDGSGEIDIVDVLALNKYLLGVGDVSEAGRTAADVDKNGKVEDSDAMNILRYIVKLIPDLESLSS